MSALHRLLLLACAWVPFIAAENAVMVQRVQWNFAETWIAWREPAWASVQRVDAVGTRVVLAPEAAGQETILFTHEREGRPVGRARALHLEVEADAAGATVAPRLLDAQGRWLIATGRPIVAGRQTLRWEVPADFRDQTTAPMMPLRFNDLFLVRGPGPSPIAITFTACRVEDSLAPAQVAAVSIDTGSPIGLVAPGGKAPTVRLRNPSAVPLALRVELESSTYQGVIGTWAGDLDLLAGGEAFPPLPGADTATSGIRWLRWRISGRDDGSSAEGLGSWAVVAPHPRQSVMAPGFLYTVCTHTERWGAAEQDLEVLASAALGVSCVRTGQGWGAVNPAFGVWKWDGLDRLVDRYGAQGIELQPILGYGNAWANKPGGDYSKAKPWFHPPRIEPWREYVRASVERYRGRIRFWEVWNEPDLEGFFPGSTAEYIELLRAAYEEVRRADPSALVMTGGFAGLTDHGARATNPFLMEEVLAKAPDAFDILAFHQHGSFAEVFQPIVDGPLARLRAKLVPPKPLWFNETAVSYHWSSTTDLMAKQAWQADELVRKLSFARARDSIGYTWYDLRNDGEDPRDFEHNFGLVTKDFQPKAAFCAYAEMIRRLRGLEFARAVDLGPGRHGFLFSAGSEHAVVLFNQDPRTTDLQVGATWDAGASAELVDAMGAPIPGTGGTATGRALVVGHRPSLLLIHGGSAPRITPLITVADPGPVLAGRPLTAMLSFTNPLPEATTVHLAWRLPAALGGTVAESDEVVPAGGTITAAPSVVVPTGSMPGVSDQLTGRIEWSIAGGAWRGVVSVPLRVAVVVPPGPVVDRPADFTLDDQRQVTNRFMNDPARTALLWRGPEDLSARVWLEHAEGRLTLRVVVRDSVHHQQFLGAETWKADGVQIGLSVPGQQGWWELGFARGDDGANQVWSWRQPAGFADPAPAVRLTTTRVPGGVDYCVTIPDAVLGLDPRALTERGLAFNLVVNDDDGEGGRKGWIQIAPGIADNKDPSRFPLVVFTQ